MSPASAENPPSQRIHHTATLAGDTLVVIGGIDPNNIGYSFEDTWVINTASIHEVPGEGGGVSWSGQALWASPTHLPTSSAEFTHIAALGDNAGIMSCAVLNDRAVFTEGIADPPWVWGGAMSDDASDWLTPKAVLVSQDGSNFYDVSPQVCDKDPDTVANIGNIRTSGGIYICCDMPEVEGFYLEMGTPNEVTLECEARTYIEEIAFTSSANFEQQDLKGTIDRWVQDSAGLTGHFEDSGDTPLTLGTDNACPLVQVGLTVEFTDANAGIVGITPDGEGTDEVTLSAAHPTADVSHIYGMAIDSTAGLTVPLYYSNETPTWSTATRGASAYGGYSIRQIVKASEISTSGNRIRITLENATHSFAELGAAHRAIGGAYLATPNQRPALLIKSVSIVERDGNTANGTGTPTDITFPAPEDFTTSATVDGKHYIDDIIGSIATGSATSGGWMVSDSIAFDLDETKDYIVTMDLVSAWVASSTTGMRRGGFLNNGVGSGYYYKEAPTGAYFPSESGNATVDGFAFQRYNALGLVKIEVHNQDATPSRLLVARTTDEVQFDASVMEDFQRIAVTQDTPGDSAIYHAVSLDGRETYQVFTDTAWRTIVRESGGGWQYLDGSDVWQNAANDTLLDALHNALVIPENQMTKAGLEAITSSQWKSTGGIVLRVTSSIDMACGLLAVSPDAPSIRKYTIIYNDTGTLGVQVFSGGSWTSGAGWADNTQISDVPWARSGTVMYHGPAPLPADYHVLSEVPGFWFRLLCGGTNAGCSVSRILYKAPCQPLSNIGDGQPDTPLGFIYENSSTGFIGDYTVQVSDNVMTELSKADVPMSPGDSLYIGYYLPFNQVEITPYSDNNANSSILLAEYWNGEMWAGLTVVDGTTVDGKTFSTKGKVSWTEPSDWRSRIILDASFPRGYWVRFSVSGPLAANAAVSEVRIYAVPPTIAKHKTAVTVRDRIALLGRLDAPDQCDISRALEEYGFTGNDSGSYRVGGMDAIQAAVAAWDGLFVGKSETWHQLVGSAPVDFRFQTVEAARHIPENSRVIVRAPMAGIDAGTRYGLFFINRFGAFVSTGLHTDAAWNSARGSLLSDWVTWWNQSSLPRLHLDGLHHACGEYWPVQNWIVWSVPMVTEPDRPVPSRNNRLIVFDLSLQTWLPPFTISLASLTTAYHYDASSPGKVGDLGLYGGDYQGRIVRLFGPSDASDLGVPINAWMETGWLHLGSPEWLKLIRRFQLYGQTEAGRQVVVKIWADGNTGATAPNHVMTLTELDCVNRGFSREEATLNIQGRFFKFRIEFPGRTHIYGMQIGTSFVREWGAV
jgi:hypothetical protein